MTLTDAQLAELNAIILRDAGANDSWFVGPRGSFSAAAARDRRFLLELVNTLRHQLHVVGALTETMARQMEALHIEKAALAVELAYYAELPDTEGSQP